MATIEKNWMVILFIFAGLVIGGLLGEVASQVEWLGWLSYGQTFGIENPFVLDFNVLSLTFAFALHINIASIIGMAIAIFLYRKAY
ncbi:MAG: DUF4321 domain-containing protein [Clostridia bacterium]|nr:DUF4321 domain-containing protein [Clostridia bacterium]